MAEARNINLFLIPIRIRLDELEQMPFDQCEPYLRPLMHTVCLVWANSDYYNTPTRIIVLMQEICNLIIEMVSARSLGVSALFIMYVVLRQGDRVCGGCLLYTSDAADD